MGCFMLVFAFFHSQFIRIPFAPQISPQILVTHTHKPRREAFWEEILNGLEEVDRLPHFFFFVAFMLYFLVVGIDQQLR